jgi:hypothetical protein
MADNNERGNIDRGKNIPPCCRDYRLTGKHLKTCPQHRSWLQFLRDIRKSKAGQSASNEQTIADIASVTDGGYSVRPNPDSWNRDARHDKAQDEQYGDFSDWIERVTITVERRVVPTIDIPEPCQHGINGLYPYRGCDYCDARLAASKPKTIQRHYSSLIVKDVNDKPSPVKSQRPRVHPLFTGTDNGKDYREGQLWRADIPKAGADY